MKMIRGKQSFGRRGSTGAPLLLRCALVTALALAGCAAAKEPMPAPVVANLTEPAQKDIENCDAWSTLMDGPYRYNNNQWGSDKAKGPGKQCLLERHRGSSIEHGWSWDWPGFDASVFAYPEIEFGWKPWTGGKSTDARFPMRVANMPRLVLNYEVETEATGSFDLAPEIWLIDPKPSDEKNPQLITTEVMFWMDYAEGARPAGQIVETPTLDGIAYELWKEDKIGQSANGKGWLLLSFKSKAIRRQGRIGIDTLLKYLVEKKLVDPEQSVASIEFGNEVMGGRGTTWVKRFDVEVGQ